MNNSPYNGVPKLLMPTLPKQWRHWCRKLGLRQTTPTTKKWHRANHCWMYLRGKGFMWRVNCFAEFERGDPCDRFDRWARCNIDMVDLPRTFDEFKSAVETLVNAYAPTRK